MHPRLAPLSLALLLIAPGLRAQGRPPLDALLDKAWPELDALYLDLHRHPELSGKEVRTAGVVAGELRKAGYAVTEKVGGTGVVGVLRNGEGPVVYLRTELDALPVEEKTGLPHASENRGVMHACGHDVHMSGWVGAAQLLAGLRSQWRGTVVMIGQPAEEIVEGARGMLADGLLTRFPKPDAVVAVHDSSELAAGKVSWVAGYAMANVDAADITLFGRGSHGARPELSVDPIVLAAKVVLGLQVLISRERDPLEPAVLTIGSLHAGTKHNIIADEARLQVTIRSYSQAVRRRLLEGVVRVAKGESIAAGSPKEPRIDFSEGQEACWNDPALARRLAARLSRELGADHVAEGRPDMVAEDFGELGKAAQVPSVMLRIGAADPAVVKAGGPLPSLHSALFAPDRQPAIRTGAKVLTLSALEILKPVEVKR